MNKSKGWLAVGIGVFIVSTILVLIAIWMPPERTVEAKCVGSAILLMPWGILGLAIGTGAWDAE